MSFHYLTLAFWLCLAGIQTNAAADSPVRALVFYGPACSECSELLEFYLPALAARQGERLEMVAFDVASPTGAAIYQAAQTDYLLPSAAMQPSVLVGTHAFTGLSAIGAALGDHFTNLAADSLTHQWPAVPGLPEALPQALKELQARLARLPTAASPEMIEAPATAWRNQMANHLSLGVLIGMSLITVLSLRRAWRDVPSNRYRPAWIVITLLIGLGISAYTAYTSLAAVATVCGPIGDCATVQQSSYARLWGIPMGVLGLIGYGIILLTWWRGRLCNTANQYWRMLSWSLAFLGVLFSIRLTTLEVFVIHATCLWCVGSAITSAALFWLLSSETQLRRPCLN